MSTRHGNSAQAPVNVLADRLDELADAVVSGLKVSTIDLAPGAVDTHQQLHDAMVRFAAREAALGSPGRWVLYGHTYHWTQALPADEPDAAA